MADMCLFVGGVRCGKSALAQKWLEDRCPKRLYLATCQPGDAEMAERVQAHQKNRGKGWFTLEEPLDIMEALKAFYQQNYFFKGGILIDCLSMWVNNALAVSFTERKILDHTAALLEMLKAGNNPCAIVSLECGLGFMPMNQLARKFGDILGRVNQLVANFCPQVLFVCCGIPLHLK